MRLGRTVTLCGLLLVLDSFQGPHNISEGPDLPKVTNHVVEVDPLISIVESEELDSFIKSGNLAIPILLSSIEDFPENYHKLPFEFYPNQYYSHFVEFRDLEGTTHEIKWKYYNNHTTLNATIGSLDDLIKIDHNLTTGDVRVLPNYDSEGRPQERISSLEAKSLYQQFFKKMFSQSIEVYKENILIKEVRSPPDYEKAVDKTTKPTVILISADWCGPCQYLKKRELRPFFSENRGKYDFVRVDATGHEQSTGFSDWEPYFQKKYGVNNCGLPSVIFLDKNKDFLGIYLPKTHGHFSTEAKEILLKKQN